MKKKIDYAKLTSSQKIRLANQLAQEDMAKSGLDYSTNQLSIGLRMLALADQLQEETCNCQTQKSRNGS